MYYFPSFLLNDFQNGKITKQQFICKFSDWQKTQGIDLTVKGTSIGSDVYFIYRGQHGKITKGKIDWLGVKTDTVFEFCRVVDFNLRRSGQCQISH